MPILDKVNIPAASDSHSGYFYVSLVKSTICIGAGAILLSGVIVAADILLILAELLRIVEEIV